MSDSVIITAAQNYPLENYGQNYPNYQNYLYKLEKNAVITFLYSPCVLHSNIYHTTYISILTSGEVEVTDWVRSELPYSTSPLLLEIG